MKLSRQQVLLRNLWKENIATAVVPIMNYSTLIAITMSRQKSSRRRKEGFKGKSY